MHIDFNFLEIQMGFKKTKHCNCDFEGKKNKQEIQKEKMLFLPVHRRFAIAVRAQTKAR